MNLPDAISLAAFLRYPEYFKLAEDPGSAEPIARAVSAVLGNVSTLTGVTAVESIGNKRTPSEVTAAVRQLREKMQSAVAAAQQKQLDWSKFDGDPVGTGKMVKELKNRLAALEQGESQVKLLQESAKKRDETRQKAIDLLNVLTRKNLPLDQGLLIEQVRNLLSAA